MSAPATRSFSQISTYGLCPERYRRRYIEKDYRPSGTTLARGSAYHKGAETNFRQKIETHADLTVDDIVDASVAALDDVTSGREELTLTEAEQSVGKKKTIKKLVDEVVEMSELLAKKQAPRYQPVGVEESFELIMPDGVPNVVGRLDIRTERGVTDFKSSGRKATQDEADASIQLTTYGVAYHGITGEPATDLRYDRAIITATKCFDQVITTERTPEHLHAFALRMHQMERSIQAGIFVPCDPNAWNCSARWCEYWSDCPYVAGERQLYQLETRKDEQ